MDQIGELQNKYWSEFYSSLSPKLTLEPSSFCRLVVDKYLQKADRVLELCSGNGRDSYFLGKHCASVTAVDFATLPENRDNVHFNKIGIVDFLNSSDPSDFDVVYSRFGLHSLSEEIENRVLDFANRVCFEFRSDKDHSFVSDHFRRTINFERFLKKLEARGLTVEYSVESTGLAVYKNEDPVIIRVVAGE